MEPCDIVITFVMQEKTTFTSRKLVLPKIWKLISRN